MFIQFFSFFFFCVLLGQRGWSVLIYSSIFGSNSGFSHSMNATPQCRHSVLSANLPGQQKSYIKWKTLYSSIFLVQCPTVGPFLCAEERDILKLQELSLLHYMCLARNCQTLLLYRPSEHTQTDVSCLPVVYSETVPCWQLGSKPQVFNKKQLSSYPIIPEPACQKPTNGRWCKFITDTGNSIWVS